MKYIFLHGLGQNSSSWEKTIDVMNDNLDIDCPNLFTLLQGREVNYSNLYQVFSEYCKTYSQPLNICGLSLGGILALQYLLKIQIESILWYLSGRSTLCLKKC